MAEPVFYDPRRARWKRLRRLIDVSAVVISALIIFFVYTALRDEPLPELLFSPQKRAFKALKESEKEKSPRSPEEAGGTLSSQVEAGGVAGQAESGRRHSGGVLCSVGRGQFFVAAQLCPSDRHSLSRLAARAHHRRTTAGRGRSDQQVFRRGAGRRVRCRSTTA